MLIHILQKDLKRKRTMNIILLLFIMLASTFLAASVNNLLTLTNAMDFFLDVAKVPDYIIIAVSETDETPIDGFLEECAYVTEYETQDMYMLTGDAIEIVYSANDPDNHKYERGNSVMLEAVPDNFSKVFDSEDAPVTLKAGEIAIPQQQAKLNNLLPGDKVKIVCGDNTMEFTVAAIVKDALLGSELIGTKRLFIQKEDYEKLTNVSERYHTMLYNVNCSDLATFQKVFKQQNFEIVVSIDKSTIKMCYFFNTLIAGVLVVVGICLILVSFLILRFTIVFTLQEDYKEIGIMKAIGISDIRMRGIYLLKYSVLAFIGSAIGLGFSFPFKKILLSQALDSFVIPTAGSNALLNLLCAVFIVVIVLLFCYGCTGKIRKYTAIEAIRNGGNGERYNAGRKLRLHKRKGLLPCAYLACNDVFSHVRRYLVLAVIFCIGTMEILLPLSAIHTMKDDSIIRTFNMQPSSVYIDTGDLENYVVQTDNTLLRSTLHEMKNKFAAHGLEAQVWIELLYTIPCYGENPDEQAVNDTYTMQQLGKEEDDYEVLEGCLPALANEVMVTEKTAQELGVTIGDSVYYQFPDGEKEFIVTGIFQSMMNMGYGLRVSRAAKMPYQTLGGLLAIQAAIESDLTSEELKELTEEIFPDYKITSAREQARNMIGVIDQMDTLQIFITILVLVINALITVLMVKTLITRERGEIAMLKSIGFADRTIRGWQSMRILVVLFVAILAGTLLSGLLGPVTIGAAFSVMGATSIKLVTNPVEAYLIYPLLMLAVTGAAAYLCAAEIKKVEMKEINTIE